MVGQILNFEKFISNNMDKKFLVLEPFMWTPHLETSFEINDFLIESGCNVVYESFLINKDIEDRWDLKRLLYRYISIKPFYILGRKFRREGLRALMRSVWLQLKSLRSSGMLFNYDESDLNDSIYSSWMSIFKVTDPDEIRYKKFYNRMYTSLKRISTWIDLCCIESKPDYVILFNGRFASTRLIRRYCEHNNIEFIVHERGSSKDKFSLWLNSIPHDPVALSKSFDNFLNRFSDEREQLLQIGRKFYELRRGGKTKGWHSFMTDFQSMELEALLSKGDNKIVTYFTSTEDEFKALHQDLPPNGPLAEQLDAILATRECCVKLGYHFILRLHPNLSTRDAGERKKYPKENWVIEPEERVSSYALIKRSKKILTHNSQIALEASALGIPAAYTGRTRFENLSPIAKCRDKNDILNFLAQGQLNREDQENALLFGAYLDHFGVNYKNYKARSHSSGSFNGLNLNLPLEKFL